MGSQNVNLSEQEKQKLVNQAASIGIFGNIILTAFKLFAGITGNSTAMVTDAIHSMSDVLATFIAFIGVKISKKGADDSHPYGHERFECFAAIIVGSILTFAGINIGMDCINRLVTKAYLTAGTPEMIAVVAAVVSIVSKEGMYWYTIHIANKIQSSAFKADAWHHRSDALSSVGSLAGIVLAMVGFPFMDIVAGLIICIIIIYVGLIEIIKDAVDKLVDSSADPEVEKEIREIISEYSESEKLDIGVDEVLTRKFGERVFADIEINMDGNLKLHAAHDIAENLHEAIEKQYNEIKHITIHVNPRGYDYKINKM